MSTEAGTPRDRAQSIERMCLDASVTGDPDPLFIYRRMVRSRFREVLVASTPRFTKVVGSDTIDVWLARWLNGDGPKTRLYWQLPLTAEASARSLVDDGLVAPWAHALLTYELAVWRVRHTPFARDPVPEAFSFERAPLLTHAHARLDLPFAASDVSTEPETTRYVFFRRADDTVGVRVLNRVGALVFDAFAERTERSVTERIRTVLEASSLKGGPAFASSLGEMLAEWMEDSLLLGSVGTLP